MKKPTYLFLVQFTFMVTIVYGQFDEREGVIVNDGYPGGIIETINLEPVKAVEGSFYINNNWSVGNVLFYNGNVINGMPLKYNLRDEMLILLDQNQITRVMRDDQIEKFNWFDIEKNKSIHFINCLDYKLEGTPMVGFMEVLSEGKTDLLLYRELTVREGYYSVTHDAGSKNDEYQVKEILYLASDNILFEVKNKKTLLPYFGEYSDDIKDYVKTNALRIKNKDDLSRIIDHYNSLLEN
jgi:hypothetical protein